MCCYKSTHLRDVWEEEVGLVKFVLEGQDYSNKSTNQMHKSLRFIACRLNTVQHLGFVVPCIFNHSNKTPN